MLNRTLLAGLLLAAASAPLAAQPSPCPPDVGCSRGFGLGTSWLRFSGRMQNLVLWRNDGDFDRTPPYYEAPGQEIGLLGTFLAPRLELTPVEPLRVVWESELGLNLWSLHDPDEYAAGSDRAFRLAMRQLYTEGRFFQGALGFRAGYEQLFDPSGLFLGHWLGAATLSTEHRWGRLALTGAQLPDQTFEGVGYDASSFRADTFVVGLRGDFPLGRLALTGSAWGLHDRQVVGQPLDLLAATVTLGGRWSRLSFAVDLDLQYGVTRGRAAGRDETTLAWAFQGSLDLKQPVAGPGRLFLLLGLNAMLLSPDDDHDGNARNGAFYYSGKSRSRTLLLTEDELRDRGGNLDERLGERRPGDGGKHTLVRPGLAVTDLSVGLDALGFLRPLVTLGAAWVLNPDNALGASFVGLETDLHLELYYSQYLSFDLVGTFLQPGRAAAALVNTTGDREATDPVGQIEGVLTVWF
ncbi:MAG: hypothetical protein FJ098_09750 [Deltaproteobacteria bacterium]|nr:hypothetical protein [Deltaproteobacteria bacterium]